MMTVVRKTATFVACTLLALSACGGGDDDGEGSGAPDEAGESSARDVLVASTSTLGSENFLYPWTDVSVSQALQPVFETLLERVPEDATVRQDTGRLAETWSVNEDFTEYTFNLRQGVEFHEGYGELTSADVKFSYDLYTREDSQGATANTFRTNVAAVETPDPYTVVFRMAQPFANFPEILTENIFILGIASKAYYDEVGEEAASRHPIGTGPYRFVSHEQGRAVNYEAVPDHWRQTPAIPNLRIEVVAEEAARLAGLEAGEIDLSTISYDSIEPATDAGIEVLSVPDASLPTVHLLGQYLDPQYGDGDRPPWADTDPERGQLVREALSLAIGREEILDAVLSGRGNVDGACAPSFFPTNPGYDDGCETDAYDPTEAVRLLAEAGYEDPSDLEITVNVARHPTAPYGSDVLEAVAQQWQNLGISVEVESTDWAAMTDLNIGRQATSAIAYAHPVYFDAAALLAAFSRSTDALSFTGESAELDELINTALAAYEPDDIDTTRTELFDYLAEGRFSIPVLYADLVFGMNPDLEWTPLPNAGGTHHFEYMSYGS